MVEEKKRPAQPKKSPVRSLLLSAHDPHSVEPHHLYILHPKPVSKMQCKAKQAWRQNAMVVAKRWGKKCKNRMEASHAKPPRGKGGGGGGVCVKAWRRNGGR